MSAVLKMLQYRFTVLILISLLQWIALSEVMFVIVVLDYDKAGVLAKEYASTKGPGITVKPQDHLFFRKLGPIVQRTLDKCVRENGFM